MDPEGMVLECGEIKMAPQKMIEVMLKEVVNSFLSSRFGFFNWSSAASRTSLECYEMLKCGLYDPIPKSDPFCPEN